MQPGTRLGPYEVAAPLPRGVPRKRGVRDMG